MKGILTLIFTGALAIQTVNLLQAQAKVLPPSDLNIDNLPKLPLSANARQIPDEDDIDTDGPFGYVPRVVHGVNKIVKGLLNGSMHSVFHGAFGIAPDDVAEDLVGTYNQIMGIPDPDDLPEKDADETTEKGVVKKPGKVPTATGNDKAKGTEVKGQTAGTGSKATSSKNKKKPVSTKGEEDTREEDDEEEDDI